MRPKSDASRTQRNINMFPGKGFGLVHLLDKEKHYVQ